MPASKVHAGQRERSTATKSKRPSVAAKPPLLAGGNPQIANVKVTFFRGTSLRPVPAGGTGKDARWIDIHEADLDEARMAGWIRQAASLPGWDGGSRATADPRSRERT